MKRYTQNKGNPPGTISVRSALNRLRRTKRLSLACLGCAVMVAASLRAGPARAEAVTEIDLVTNDQTAHPAQLTDTDLVNAWGVSHSATTPFWVSDNGTGKSTLYSVNPTTNAVTKVPLVVTIPGDGSVTGQVFNTGSGAFNGDNFLFVSEDGTRAGWRGALGTAAETLAVASVSNVYKGAALATVGGATYLYAANFRAGKIDVFPGTGGAPALPGNFTDPTLPSGYAPFNVQNLNGKLYVTYAVQDSQKHDEAAGPGKGIVSVFDLSGNFLGRVGTGGTLNAHWGLAIAPSSFGNLAGDLLVGNFGDGTINAFNLTTDTFAGQLTEPNGATLAIDGLWALNVGNGGSAGSDQKLYFTAGPDDESNGLFGVLIPAPEPGSLAVLGAGLIALYAVRRRRSRV